MDDDKLFSDNLIDPKGTPTVDIDSERAVLCLCLKHSKALEKCGRSLIKEDFADPRNACIFDSILALYMESRNIDRYTVGDALEDKGLMTKAGGRPYLYGIADMVAILANIDDYISNVVEKSRLRKIEQSLNKYQKLIASGKTSADSLIDQSVTELSALRGEDDGVGFERLDKILKDNLNTIKEVSSGKGKKNINTGFLYLDKKMGGMAPGSLNIIAARPGMGKTAFAINIATNVATMQQANVNIFSLEMSKAEIGNRVLASRTKTSSRELQQANLSEEKQLEVLNAIKKLQALNIYVDDKSDMTPVTMMSKLKELKTSGKLGLVIIDYIQLMSSGTNRSGANRQTEIADISRSLKLMAKEMEVPIIALSQLSRGAEKRDDHTPMLSDLRDSGAIEQDADTVIFIDRPDYYLKGEEKPEICDAHIILAKNRKGETGQIKLKWHGKKTLFFEEDRINDPVDPEKSGGMMRQKESSYTRTTDSSSASSDYNFEEDNYAQAASDYSPDDIPPEDINDIPVDDNVANEEFFDESHDDFPPGMMDD